MNDRKKMEKERKENIGLETKNMKKGSHVVTISSMGGIQGSLKFPGLAAYSSSKGAVITL